MTRDEYLFQCVARNPKAQHDLFQFLRKFPVFYRLSIAAFPTYGEYEAEVRKRWNSFLTSNKGRFQKVQESQSSLVLKYTPRSGSEAFRLADWVNEISEIEWQTTRTASLQYDAEPRRVVEEIEPFPSVLAALLRAPPYFANPTYFSRIQATPEDYRERQEGFSKTWGFPPHRPSCFAPMFGSMIGPKTTRIVLHRLEVRWMDPSVKLFIPVTDTLTKKELNRKWSEIVSAQVSVYKGKKRFGRKQYETLLKIYDLRQKGRTNPAVGSGLGLSTSRVKELYGKVYKDIHGVGPGKGEKSKRLVLQRQRSRKAPFLLISQIQPAAESEEEILGDISLDLGIPRERLERAAADSSALTKAERANVTELLRKRQRGKRRP